MKSGRRGWTIVEVVIVIVIVGLLVSLLVPGLHYGRSHALASVTLANLRSHTQVFFVYAGDYQDSLPFLAVASVEPTHHSAGGYSTEMLVFTQYASWPIAMAGEYYGGNVHSASFHPPGSNEVGPISEYWYSQSFVADPKFWMREYREYSTTQLRAVMIHEVVFPSSKGLFIERDPALESWRTHHNAPGKLNFSLVDGAAKSSPASDLQRAYPGGCSGFLLGPIIGLPVLHTVDGVRGRDISH
ncbi:MAG: hypothetical protein KF757_00960 [Phycisphaeraceae bacterium]|nr:hypothetical protein [Phycisphaeraceae bacterium]MCW5761777.1 hypothetical protein [Phycisphaeraceae bacterium]